MHNNFTGRDPVAIIMFLTEFANICDELEITEPEAYLALLNFIDGDAYISYRTAVKSSSGSGRTVSSWPSAVVYLLKHYATNNAITEALQDSRIVALRRSETEEQYHSRFVQ